MARWAVIRNTIVENVCEWDGVTPWTPPAGTTLQPATPDAVIGATWNGTVFVRPAPPPPLTDRQIIGDIVAALALLTLEEINVLRQWITSFKAAVAASTSLADLRTRVAALSNTPDRTRTQLLSAVTAKLSDGSLDG